MNNDDRNKKKKVAVVTGSSSGIGFETSLLLARNGFYTYATMRTPDNSKAITNIKQKEKKLSLKILQLDVTSDKSVKEAIQNITNEQERIDVLVNNAGYALVGPFEELSIEEFKEQFETNLFGVIRVTQAVLPIMRRQRNGTIVNISSIAGKIGFPLTTAYTSSKFALEGLSESMAYETEQFGVRIILIEPGVIKTNFNNNLKIGKKVAIDSNSNSPYGEMTQKRISRFKPRFESGTPPIEVAKVILKAITASESQLSELRYLVGSDAFKLMKIRNNISDKEFGKVVIKSVL